MQTPLRRKQSAPSTDKSLFPLGPVGSSPYLCHRRRRLQLDERQRREGEGQLRGPATPRKLSQLHKPPQGQGPKPARCRPTPTSHHLLLCRRPRSRVRPAISSSCFLISRKFEKSPLADKMGTPGVVRATGTTEGLAAIFLSQPPQPISGDDASGAPASKKLACYWCALAPGQAISDLASHNVTKRPGKRRPSHPRLAKS